MREMITMALDRVGGVDYLARQAEANPVAFLGLIGKIIPKNDESKSPSGVSVVYALQSDANL